MIVSERVRERMEVVGLSQSELARRVGVTQGAIAKVANNNPNGSSFLHKIAQHLRTSPAYLVGEIDDPDAGAPPPPPPLRAQHLMLPVALPPEEGLYRAYLGLLMASRHMDEDALARELAKRLPTMLEVLKGPLTIEYHDDEDAAEAPPSAHPARRRA